MKDPCSKIRKKSRFIVELRYEAIPDIFDKEGKIISDINPKVRNFLPHWNTKVGMVKFIELPEPNNKHEFAIAHNRTLIAFEDLGSVSDFLSKVDKYLSYMYSHIGEAVNNIARCGVRFIEVMDMPKVKGIKKVNERIFESFFKLPSGIPIKPKDVMQKIDHEDGHVLLGPTTSEEKWAIDSFRDSNHMPFKYGVGLDIDSYKSDTQVNNIEELRDLVHKVYDRTKAIEESISKELGLYRD
ncbi:MAG: hypothetical protein H8E26_14280 [FCB group bacterium]|nr:hypothetical protein [FCB group bacterium]MBL7027452.1 hypothetical protein [Candidatus Neomarinimicrobiota bacterium]MBL7122065.1 hypothetical protein [Candidatus Neomarinimicrobiota bacterium]